MIRSTVVGSREKVEEKTNKKSLHSSEYSIVVDVASADDISFSEDEW